MRLRWKPFVAAGVASLVLIAASCGEGDDGVQSSVQNAAENVQQAEQQIEEPFSGCQPPRGGAIALTLVTETI